MWGQLNNLTKQLAEQATNAVKEARLDETLGNVGNQMAGGLDKLTNSVLLMEDPTQPSDMVATNDVPVQGSSQSRKDGQEDQVEHASTENTVMQQRLAAVEEAALEAFGELEESKDQLQQALSEKAAVESDLQKTKHELAKVRRNLRSTQNALEMKKAELDDCHDELEQMKANNAETEVPEGNRETGSRAWADSEKSKAKLLSSLQRKDEEITSLRALISHKDDEISQSRQLADQLTNDMAGLKTSKDLQQQLVAQHEKDLASLSSKLSLSASSAIKKSKELKVVANLIKKLEEQVEALDRATRMSQERMCSLPASQSGNSNEGGEVQRSNEETSCTADKALLGAVIVQINIEDADVQALREQLQDSKDVNEALEFDVQSYKNEVQLLSESICDLKSLVASKDVELVEIASKATSEYSESAKLGDAENRLRQSQIQIDLLNDEIEELKSSVSHWENRFLASAEEAKSLNGRCQVLMAELDEKEEKLSEFTSKEIALKDEQTSNSEEIGLLKSAATKMEKELSEALESLEAARKQVQEIDELRAEKSNLEINMDLNKASMMDMKSNLKAATDELIKVQHELETEKIAGEGRKKKFVMLQTAFSKREDALNAENLSLHEEINHMHNQHDAQVGLSESELSELKELREVAAKLSNLQARCSHLETALSNTQKACEDLQTKLQAAEKSAESERIESDRLVTQLRETEALQTEKAADAQQRLKEAESQMLNLESQLDTITKQAQDAESELKVQKAALLLAEAQARAAESAKIAMTLSMAEMTETRQEAKGDAGSSSTRPTTPTAKADIEGFKSQLANAKEEAEQLRWQLKMMMKAQESPGNSSTSWILGCVSNRKQ